MGADGAPPLVMYIWVGLETLRSHYFTGASWQLVSYRRVFPLEMGNDCQGRRASGGERLSPESEAEVE